MAERAAGSCAFAQFLRQLGFVNGAPLLDEAGGGSGEFAADDRAVVDANQRFVLGVDRVEVRWVVIAEVHVDHDPVELTQARHDSYLRLHLRWGRAARR